jgi:hypothetical protein
MVKALLVRNMKCCVAEKKQREGGAGGGGGENVYFCPQPNCILLKHDMMKCLVNIHPYIYILTRTPEPNSLEVHKPTLECTSRQKTGIGNCHSNADLHLQVTHLQFTSHSTDRLCGLVVRVPCC